MEENPADNENVLKPLLVTWSHGTLRPESSSRLNCNLLSKIKCPQKVIGLVVSDNDRNVYLSKSDDSQYCNNFLVIRNKKSNKIRVYGADNYLMLPFESSTEKETSVSVPAEGTPVETQSARVLNKTLGSKRLKRRIDEIEKVNAQVENIETKFKKEIEEKKLNLSITSPITPSQGNELLLPPCNRDASCVEQVYNVKDIISSELLDSFEDMANEVLDSKNLTELDNDGRFSPFFVKLLSQMKNSSVLKVKMLIFADTLLTLTKTPARSLTKKSISKYSHLLAKKLTEDYCVTFADGKLARPPSMQDKAICHMLILLLLCGNYTVDSTLLSGELSILQYKRLPILLRTIGARPVAKSSNTFVLKLPLADMPKAPNATKKLNKLR